MDPNLFHIDYERLFEVLVSIVVFAFLIERALSVIFESRFFIELTEERDAIPEVRNSDGTVIKEAKPAREKKKGVRELIALAVSILFCFYWEFDAITITLASSDHMTVWGKVLSGAIIAGGSKVSTGLFRDVMGFMSSAEKERQTTLKQERNTQNRVIIR